MMTTCKQTIFLSAKYLCFAISIFLTACDKEEIISTESLPESAQQFIQKHFPNDNILQVKYEKEGTEKQYNVLFNNGNKIEFYKSGEWKKIECISSSIPQAIIPQAIDDFVTSNHSGQKIVKIEKEKQHIEIELSNMIEIRFNKSYSFIGYDN